MYWRGKRVSGVAIETKKCSRLGMCRSCYNIRSELKKLHKEVERTNAKFGSVWPRRDRFFILELQYNIAPERAESAQVLGQRYERFLQNAETLDCEMEFRWLSKRFVKRELFYHHAFLFERFSPVHRRYLMYLIGQIMQESYSRNHRNMAYGVISQKTMKEVLAERSWGTYRVEKDIESSSRRKKQ